MQLLQSFPLLTVTGMVRWGPIQMLDIIQPCPAPELDPTPPYHGWQCANRVWGRGSYHHWDSRQLQQMAV